MIYVKINDALYEASVSGRVSDRDWNDRDSKTIRTNQLTAEEAKSLFTDNAPWSIVMVSEEGTEEYDNSDYSVAGELTDYRDGYIAIKMGKETDLEQAYELLYGGVL